MRHVSRRAAVVLVLAGLVLAGLLVLLIQYVFQAKSWAAFPGSPHVYRGNNLTAGTVTDRGGELLLRSDESGRSYAADETLRKATLHLLGDRYGYIPSNVLSDHAADMIGFDLVQGLYHSSSGTMRLSLSAAANTTAYQQLAGRHGCVAVYNYRTGEILCLVSAPSYDPDNMPDIEGDSSGQYDGVYVNRPVAGTYTPGSIFKLVTAAAALEQLDDLDTRTFYCGGVTEIGGKPVHCLNVHGSITFREALAKSCNVVFGQLAAELGADTINGYAAALGVTQSLSFDGLRTAAGSVQADDSDPWELAWAGIGQSTDLINPVQYMTLMGAIANGGQAALPYLVEEIPGQYQAETAMLPAALSQQTADRLAELMINNVQTVYGSWNFPSVTVGAKSGTAEQDPGQLANATFAGFVQDENYPLAFVAVVEHAGSGSEVCIPIISAVLQVCIQQLAQP